MSIFVSDIDDVILHWVLSVCGYTAREHGMTTQYDDFTTFEFVRVWNTTVEECDRILDGYFESVDFLNLKPRVDAVVGLNSLKNSGRTLHALTSRHDLIRDHTLLTIPQILPDVFSGIHFSSNIHTDRSSGKSKTEVLVDLNADYFSEDNLHYAFEAADVVQFVYLFRHPWNRNYTSKPDNVIEVDDWYEVTAHQRSLER